MKKAIVLILILVSINVFSQVSKDVRIMELKVYATSKHNSQTMEVDTNYIDLSVGFKIVGIEKASTVTILIGTQPDNSSVLTLSGTISKQGEEYKITINNQPYDVFRGYETMMVLPSITKSTLGNLTRYLTVYVTDASGKQTEHLNKLMY